MKLIKLTLLAASLAALSSCMLGQVPEAAAEPVSSPETEGNWRAVDAENLLLIETRYGVTAIELNQDFAPAHVAQIRKLTRAGAYDGAFFYRVIDGFVAQAGLQDETATEAWPTLENENDRALSEAAYTPLGNDDLFAGDVGHSASSFAMARDEALGREWLLHCPGAMAMARDADPDSGSTEFYIVLDAQRYLDRNLTVFGRVIDGMQYIQKLERGDRAIESGVIQAPRTGDKMISVRIASDIDEADRPGFEVMQPGTGAFETAKADKRVRSDPFFYRTPPEVLDICGFEVPVRESE